MRHRRQWNELEDLLVWGDADKPSPVAHARVLPRSRIAQDLADLVDIVRSHLSDLEIPKSEYAERVEEGLRMVARFLVSECALSKPPSRAQGPVMALAATFVRLEAEYDRGRPGIDYPLSDTVRDKLARWYWAQLLNDPPLARLSAIERTVDELATWLKDVRDTPRVVASWNDSLLPLNDPPSHHLAYCADALILRGGPRDLYTGEPLYVARLLPTVTLDKVDAHHIFPREWCHKRGIPQGRYDSIVNLTPLSARANRGLIRDRGPSEYLADIVQHGIERARLDEILRGHLIEPEALWSDDFDAFFQARSTSLRRRFARAIQGETRSDAC
jgi:hypothetical protein